MVDCPTCERPFDSKTGMKIHHKSAHGESLAGVTVSCDTCGVEFSKPTGQANAYDRHFCSRECQNIWQVDHHKGENNPRWVEKTTAECEVCGRQFKYLESRRPNARFCSIDCKVEMMKGEYTAENNPRWKPDKTKECIVCGSEFNIWPSVFDLRKTCSVECQNEYYEQCDTYRGQNNVNWKAKIELKCEQCGERFEVKPSIADGRRFCSYQCMGDAKWKGGKSIYQVLRRFYSNANWETVRSRYLADKCQLCTRESNLILHHIIPIRVGGTHHPDNLMMLCEACHAPVEVRTREFTEPHLTKYAQVEADHRRR